MVPQIRVLMVNYEFPPFGGGTGLACRHLLDELARRGGVAVDLVTSGPVRRVERERLRGDIVVHRLPTPKRDIHYWRAPELAIWTARALGYARTLVRTRQYTFCHCWAGWPSGIVGHLLPGPLPYIVALRGSDVPGYNTRLRLLDPLVMRTVCRRVWRHAARIVAVSRDLRALAHVTQPDACIDVIPNGVDTRAFTPARPGQDGLLFVGRLIRRKGVDILIEAVRLLAAEHPGLTLTVAGDGPERARLEGMVRDYGLQEQVRFPGFLDRASLADTYRRAGVFVLPALSDAMPNVVLEAMAAGLAIITTRTGAQELLNDNGQIVERADPEALRASIARYLRDRDLLVRHQRNSRRLAETMSWAAVAEYYATLYADLCAELSTEAHGVVTTRARELSPSG